MGQIRTSKNYRFSGHETFACRYAWLSKAARAVEQNDVILTTAFEDDAMVELGVGKNMVRSARFWAEAADIIKSIDAGAGHKVTDFGRDLLLGLGTDEGHDPYLEDIQTLWLIHWKLATNQNALIFAWDFLLNQFHEPELYHSNVLRAFEKAVPSDKTVSSGSLEQMYEVFIHSYVPKRGRKGEVREDSLDCFLVELDLLRHTGLTQSPRHPGRFESKYAFRREEKPEVSPALFAYCLNEFWQAHHSHEQTLHFHSVVASDGSPGLIFKIPEADIRTRLLGLEKETDGYFVFEESAAIPRIVKHSSKNAPSLESIYIMESSHVR